jgi:ribosomal protein S18 acetylase RimI-like enzyme
MIIRTFQPADEDTVIALWRNCGLVVAHNNPHADIERKLRDSPEGFLVGVEGEKIVAAMMVGYDGHRGWINYLAVSPDRQQSGRGRAMMAHAEALLRAQGCPKINLQVRATNRDVIAFYERLGFSVDPVVSLGKRLIVDPPERD